MTSKLDFSDHASPDTGIEGAMAKPAPQKIGLVISHHENDQYFRGTNPSSNPALPQVEFTINAKGPASDASRRDATSLISKLDEVTNVDDSRTIALQNGSQLTVRKDKATNINLPNGNMIENDGNGKLTIVSRDGSSVTVFPNQSVETIDPQGNIVFQTAKNRIELVTGGGQRLDIWPAPD